MAQLDQQVADTAGRGVDQDPLPGSRIETIEQLQCSATGQRQRGRFQHIECERALGNEVRVNDELAGVRTPTAPPHRQQPPHLGADGRVRDFFTDLDHASGELVAHDVRRRDTRPARI